VEETLQKNLQEEDSGES